MLDKKSMLLFVSCWLLLAVLSLPSGASAANVPQLGDPGPGTPDTFPFIDNQFAVRQAQLAYLGAKEETGMQATIRYITTLNGSTGTLSRLEGQTDASVRAISSAGTDAVLDSELANLRENTLSFRHETDLQLQATGGTPDVLREKVLSAVEGSTGLQAHLDKYWNVRESTELADFDLRVTRAEETIGTLLENGHEITPAQEKLKEIVTMRTELATALRARNNAGIELAHKKIHTTSIEYARIISNLRAASPSDSRIGHAIDQGTGVMTRSAMVNTNLNHSGIDTTHADELVTRGKIQIQAARDQSRYNDAEAAKRSLAEFRNTLQALRDTYREILVQEDLPQATAQGVLSVAQSLDITVAQMGAP